MQIYLINFNMSFIITYALFKLITKFNIFSMIIFIFYGIKDSSSQLTLYRRVKFVESVSFLV